MEEANIQTSEILQEQKPKKTKFQKLLQEIWNHRVFYGMLAPAVILLAIFAYWPMYGVTIAFKDYSPRKGILGSEWVQFEHFKTLFGPDMPGFWQAFWNTIQINFLKLIFGFPAPILLAIMLNAVRRKKLKTKMVIPMSFLQTVLLLKTLMQLHYSIT